MSGVLLDRRGRPEAPAELLNAQGIPHIIAENLEKGWVGGGLSKEQMDAALSRAPASVLDLMAKGRAEVDLRDRGRVEGFYAPPHQNSMQSWQESIYVLSADGPTLTAAANAIMVPDFTLPANFFSYPGKTVRYTLAGRFSSAITTPGTFTQILKYGGVGGTALASSGAYAPDTAAAGTNLTFWTEWWVQCRTTGSTGTVMCIGRTRLGDEIVTSGTTVVASLAMGVIPVSAPATATINTTTANALSPTWTPSLATGSMTVHLAILEALN